MPSPIKKTGVTGGLLTAMAKRGGRMTSDHRGFPPFKVFVPLHRRGLVRFERAGVRTCRYNVWHLTPKGWAATGMQPPEIADTV